jgi:hypothetical protein
MIDKDMYIKIKEILNGKKGGRPRPVEGLGKIHKPRLLYITQRKLGL